MSISSVLNSGELLQRQQYRDQTFAAVKSAQRFANHSAECFFAIGHSHRVPGVIRGREQIAHPDCG